MSKAGMTNVMPVPADTTITFGNGSKAAVEAVGDIVLRIPGSDIETLTLTDAHVYYVPGAAMNLFSIKSAVQKGIQLGFLQGQRWSVLQDVKGRQADSPRGCSDWRLRHGGLCLPGSILRKREP